MKKFLKKFLTPLFISLIFCSYLHHPYITFGTDDIQYSFENAWYNAVVEPGGNLIIFNKQGKKLLNGFDYNATYGVVGNTTELKMKNDTAEAYILLPEVKDFKVGDAVEVHSGAINNSLLFSAAIQSIQGNKVNLKMTSPLQHFEEGQSMDRILLKVTDKINKLSIIHIKEKAADIQKTIRVYAETDKAYVTIEYTFTKEEPKIDINIITRYKSQVKVFNESLDFNFNTDVTEVYKKNRQIDTELFQEEYWLDKQGVKFGQGKDSILLYHTPNVSSLVLLTHKRKLTVNLDDMRDHRWRYMVKDTGTSISKNAAEFDKGDHRTNQFTLWVGVPTSSIPRLMLNPHGYLSTYIWTEHADRTSLATHRAAYYGHQDIENPENAIGGFVKYNIPVTKSVFYDAIRTKWVAIINHPDSSKYLDFLKSLYSLGYDIGLHSATAISEERNKVREALEFMKKQFDMTTWIDHSAPLNREDFSADGLIPVNGDVASIENSFYVGDLWEKYGIKYFWSYSSEDNKSQGLNLFRTSEGEHLRTPLYWKHPTVTKDFYTWAALRHFGHEPGLWWNSYHSEFNLNKLVSDWGICINHTYPAYNESHIFKKDQNGKYVLDPEFNAMLSRLDQYRKKGLLNLTTIREIMDYWLLLENVEFQYKADGSIIVNNHNNTDIKGLSLTVKGLNSQITVDNQVPSFKRDPVNAETIFWFDIEANSQRVIRFKTLDTNKISSTGKSNPPIFVLHDNKKRLLHYDSKDIDQSGGTTLLSLKKIVEIFGVAAQWNENAKLLTISRDGKKLEFSLASDKGKAKIQNSRFMLPLFDVAKGLNTEISVNGSNIVIDTYNLSKLNDLKSFKGNHKLTQDILLKDIKYRKISSGKYELFFILEAQKDIINDYTLAVNTFANSKDYKFLPEDRRKYGWLNWSFKPNPSTNSWKKGDLIILTRQIESPVNSYQSMVIALRDSNGIVGNKLTIKNPSF